MSDHYMNYSIFRFTLNMHNHRSQASVSAFEGDTAIRLIITLTDGGIPYQITDGCVAILSGTKADGEKLYNRCVITNNTIQYDFTEQTTSRVGVVNCEITLYGADGNVITAPKFIIVVDQKEVKGEEVPMSDSEYTAIGILLEAAANENARISAEKVRGSSEASRSISEASRIEAEQARGEAEKERVKAEASRVENAKTIEANLTNTVMGLVEPKADKVYVDDKIDNVEYMLSQFGVIGEQTISETAYEVAVPTRAARYAFLNSIGGMTYKVTVKNDNVLDGGVLDATNTSVYPNEEYKERIKYLIIDKPLAEGLHVVAFDENDIGRAINTGETYVDLSGLNVAYIQLAGEGEGTINFILTETLIPYEPAYYDELRDSKVTAIESYGANIIKFPYTSSGDKVGVSITTDSDGTLTLNGTTTGYMLFDIFYSTKNPIPVNGTYTLSGLIGGSSTTYYLQPYVDGNSQLPINDSPRTYNWNGNLTRLALIAKTGINFDNVKIKPMLNYGSTAAPYKPYRAEPITYPIPEAIQVGKGINGYADTTDFENGVKTQKSYRKVFDGTENWGAGGSTGNLMTLTYGADIMPKALDRQPCVSNNLTGSTNAPNSLNEGECCVLSTSIYIRKETVSNPNGNANTVEKIANFKEWLSANPLVIEYALAEPITEDISASLEGFDGLIEVEGGGKLKFVNEHGNAVPISIDYQIINQQGVST